MRVQGTVTVVLRDGVHVRRVCGADGIPLRVLLGGDTPSIVYTIRENAKISRRRAESGTRT